MAILRAYIDADKHTRSTYEEMYELPCADCGKHIQWYEVSWVWVLSGFHLRMHTRCAMSWLPRTVADFVVPGNEIFYELLVDEALWRKERVMRLRNREAKSE